MSGGECLVGNVLIPYRTPYKFGFASQIMIKRCFFLFQGELSEEDLARAMSSLGIDLTTEGQAQGQGAGGQGQDDFLPMMQTMMKSLLSKEILYPSLKEISEKVNE